MAYSLTDSTAQAFSGAGKKLSLLQNSTVEELAKKAGLKKNDAPLSVTETEHSFEVRYSDEVYHAEFKRRDHKGDEHQVACFSVKDSGRSLTREEANDLLKIIRESSAYKMNEVRLEPIVARLGANLPHLGFRKDTPYMQYGLGTE